jgi:DNA-binding NarL/FixJ family response regulator
VISTARDSAAVKDVSVKESVTQILVVEGNPANRERLARIIAAEADFKICGLAEDFDDALQLAERCRPEVVVTGLQLKRSHGLELIKQLRTRFPRVPVLVVSMFDSSFYAERAVMAGARGFITRRQAPKLVAPAIRCVREGKVYLNSVLARCVVAHLANGAVTTNSAGMDRLTDRELEVFELIGCGLSTRKIAERMRLAISTVNTHRARIKSKLSIQGTSELLQRAITWAHRSPSMRVIGHPRG